VYGGLSTFLSDAHADGRYRYRAMGADGQQVGDDAEYWQRVLGQDPMARALAAEAAIGGRHSFAEDTSFALPELLLPDLFRGDKWGQAPQRPAAVGGASATRSLTDDDILALFGIDTLRTRMEELDAKWRAEDNNRYRADETSRFLAAGGIGLGGLLPQQGAVDTAAVLESRMAGEMPTREQRYRDFYNKGQGSASQLEKIFGKPDEFQLYTSLFKGLTDAAAASFEAIVTGSEGAGAAFQKLIANSVMAIGKQAVVEALKNVALGFGELAFGHVPQATAAFTAAAKWSAVAVVAGVTASAMGAGAGGGTGAGAASPTGVRGGSGGGDRGREVVVVMTDPFAQDSPRNRQNEAVKVVRKALGGAGGKDE
jgi:hypothetical protein